MTCMLLYLTLQQERVGWALQTLLLEKQRQQDDMTAAAAAEKSPRKHICGYKNHYSTLTRAAAAADRRRFSLLWMTLLQLCWLLESIPEDTRLLLLLLLPVAAVLP